MCVGQSHTVSNVITDAGAGGGDGAGAGEGEGEGEGDSGGALLHLLQILLHSSWKRTFSSQCVANLKFFCCCCCCLQSIE